MKLFFVPGSCSRAPHILLHELNLPFTSERVDPKNKKVAEGDYVEKINPKGHVPALLLKNGKVLTETGLLLQYIADQKPESNLLPAAGAVERYQVLEWVNFIATDFHKGISPLFYAAANELTPAYAEMVSNAIHRKLKYINSVLANQNYLTGAHYSIADIYFSVVMGWTQRVKLDLSAYPKVLGLLERVSQRPAVQATLEKEKI